MVSPQNTIVSSSVLTIYNVMKKLISILILFVYSFTAFAQSMYSDAIECMNNGEYADAKIYWEALNDRNNTYGNKIAICNTCIKLQADAKELIVTERFTKAIEKYQAILNRNPSDKNARNQIAKCKRLREEYLAANQLQTYTNSVYGYSLKYPAYMNKRTGSTDENTVFLSSDFYVRINVTSAVNKYSQSNTQIINEVANSYSDAKITDKLIKDNMVVISGYLTDGRFFYNKSIISTRKSQHNEYIKILVSAVVLSPRGDKRSNSLAKCLNENFSVNSTGSIIKIAETDDERWMRAKKLNTKEAYNNYLYYAPYSSTHREEAKARKALFQAREQYEKGLYFLAKMNFEQGKEYMMSTDKYKYEISYYHYCVNYSISLDELQKFCKLFPNNPNMRVIRGCIVKCFCKNGNFAAARGYIMNNIGVWYDENTPYSKKQWLKYIQDQQTHSKANKVKSNYPKSSNNKYKNKNQLGFTLGLGASTRIVVHDKVGFFCPKVIVGIGDNHNKLNLLLNAAFEISGSHYPCSFTTTLAPRWNILAEDFFVYAQPELSYNISQRSIMYGASVGVGVAKFGSFSIGYVYHNETNGYGMLQFSYTYNWFL